LLNVDTEKLLHIYTRVFLLHRKDSRKEIGKLTTSGLSENMYSASMMCSSGAPLKPTPFSADHLNTIAAKREDIIQTNKLL